MKVRCVNFIRINLKGYFVVTGTLSVLNTLF